MGKFKVKRENGITTINGIHTFKSVITEVVSVLNLNFSVKYEDENDESGYSVIVSQGTEVKNIYLSLNIDYSCVEVIEEEEGKFFTDIKTFNLDQVKEFLTFLIEDLKEFDKKCKESNFAEIEIEI